MENKKWDSGNAQGLALKPVCARRCFRACGCLVVLAGMLLPGAALAQEGKPFNVRSVVHPAVEGLGEPVFPEGLEPVRMAVSSSSAKAQKLVQRGMALANGMWDFEAYRHFVAAAREDPRCLMAYWGIALSLAAPGSEFPEQWKAAVERMLDLAEAKVGTELERGYAASLAYLFAEDHRAASQAFGKLSGRYSGDLQSALLSVLLLRDGYDDFGEPKQGQKEAQEAMRKLRVKHPGNRMASLFWVLQNAEERNTGNFLKREVVGDARKLARLAPDYAPYQHLLGHLEWKLGNHLLAVRAFEKACALYEKYRRDQNVPVYDCPGWVRARCYLATAYYSKGDFGKAMAIARETAAVPVGMGRLRSAGAVLLLWDARTLPARLYLAREGAGDTEAAIASLPKREEVKRFIGKSLSPYYYEGLRQYAMARQAINKKDANLCGRIMKAMGATIARMEVLEKSARMSAEYSEWLRGGRALAAMFPELAGLSVLATAKDDGIKSAFNWFSSAVSKQKRGTMLMPPAILYPMDIRLAEYQIKRRLPQGAVVEYAKALKERPNDMKTMEAYYFLLLRLGKKEEADQWKRHINRVKGANASQ